VSDDVTILAPGEMVGEIIDPLGDAEARELTERIRQSAWETRDLLLLAKSRGAWLALGYKTWETYVKEEFGYSRPYSYQLLDAAEFHRALCGAAQVSAIADITEYDARTLKPHLAEVIEAVKTETRATPPEEIAGAVRKVLDEFRAELRDQRVAARTRPTNGVHAASLDGFDDEPEDGPGDDIAERFRPILGKHVFQMQVANPVMRRRVINGEDREYPRESVRARRAIETIVDGEVTEKGDEGYVEYAQQVGRQILANLRLHGWPTAEEAG
jgi:hypothetical protein